MSASEELLKSIHDRLAQEMLARFDHKCELTGKKVPLSASEIAAYSKFLKDNNIQADPDVNPAVKEIAKKTATLLSMPFDNTKTA